MQKSRRGGGLAIICRCTNIAVVHAGRSGEKSCDHEDGG